MIQHSAAGFIIWPMLCLSYWQWENLTWTLSNCRCVYCSVSFSLHSERFLRSTDVIYLPAAFCSDVFVLVLRSSQDWCRHIGAPPLTKTIESSLSCLTEDASTCYRCHRDWNPHYSEFGNLLFVFMFIYICRAELKHHRLDWWGVSIHGPSHDLLSILMWHQKKRWLPSHFPCLL